MQHYNLIMARHLKKRLSRAKRKALRKKPASIAPRPFLPKEATKKDEIGFSEIVVWMMEAIAIGGVAIFGVFVVAMVLGSIFGMFPELHTKIGYRSRDYGGYNIKGIFRDGIFVIVSTMMILTATAMTYLIPAESIKEYMKYKKRKEEKTMQEILAIHS